MSDEQILGFVFERTSHMNVYWNFFIVVATAIFATLASGRGFTNSRVSKAILTAAFVMFVASNLLPMLEVIIQRDALLAMLGEGTALPAVLIRSLSRVSLWGVVAFHLCANAVVVLGIWMVPWARLRTT